MCPYNFVDNRINFLSNCRKILKIWWLWHSLFEGMVPLSAAVAAAVKVRILDTLECRGFRVVDLVEADQNRQTAFNTVLMVVPLLVFLAISILFLNRQRKKYQISTLWHIKAEQLTQTLRKSGQMSAQVFFTYLFPVSIWFSGHHICRISSNFEGSISGAGANMGPFPLYVQLYLYILCVLYLTRGRYD